MSFGQAIRSCWNKYFDFSGRARRSEYWWWKLFVFLGLIIFDIVDGLAGFGILSLLFLLAVILPSIAVEVRRLHDIDRSGWWYLLNFVPILGFIVLLIWYVRPGTDGPNRYGLNPLATAPDLGHENPSFDDPGTDPSARYCPECGAENSVAGRFCRKCGGDLPELPS